MSTEYRLVLCTCPDNNTAETLASAMVSAQLAACVNILPGIRSVYIWNGQIESSDECLLLLKTHRDSLEELQKNLNLHHPYDVPEIISLVIDDGFPPYLAWISSSIRDDLILVNQSG